MSQKVQLCVRGSNLFRIKLHPEPWGVCSKGAVLLMAFPYMDVVVYGYVNGVSTLIGGACYYRVTFSTEMSQKAWCNFLILNDSTCQFYYKVNICVEPYKKSCRGVT